MNENTTSLITDFTLPAYYFQPLNFLFHTHCKTQPCNANVNSKDFVHKEESGNTPFTTNVIQNETINTPLRHRVVLGYEKTYPQPILHEMFAKIKRKNPVKKFYLDAYPVMLTGSGGCGKLEALVSMATQYLDREENLVFLSNTGDHHVYEKLFFYHQKKQRPSRIHHLNFVDPADYMNNKSIDLLNPLFSEESHLILRAIFGDSYGSLIHAISLDCKKKGLILDAYNLQSILMLPNLIAWSQNNTFPSATPAINFYLNIIGFKPQDDNSEALSETVIHRHLIEIMTAAELIHILMTYEDSGVLSKYPQIVLDNIFKSADVLIVSNHHVEKSNPSQLLFLNLITANLHRTERKSLNKQNFIMTECDYCYSENLSELFLKNFHFNTNSRWIFSCYDFFSRNQDVISYCIDISNTYVFMRCVSGAYLPDNMLIKISKNIPDSALQLHSPTCQSQLLSLEQGDAYVCQIFAPTTSKKCHPSQPLTPNEKNYCELMTLFHIETPKNNVPL